MLLVRRRACNGLSQKAATSLRGRSFFLLGFIPDQELWLIAEKIIGLASHCPVVVGGFCLPELGLNTVNPEKELPMRLIS